MTTTSISLNIYYYSYSHSLLETVDGETLPQLRGMTVLFLRFHQHLQPRLKLLPALFHRARQSSLHSLQESSTRVVTLASLVRTLHGLQSGGFLLPQIVEPLEVRHCLLSLPPRSYLSQERESRHLSQIPLDLSLVRRQRGLRSRLLRGVEVRASLVVPQIPRLRGRLLPPCCLRRVESACLVSRVRLLVG